MISPEAERNDEEKSSPTAYLTLDPNNLGVVRIGLKAKVMEVKLAAGIYKGLIYDYHFTPPEAIALIDAFVVLEINKRDQKFNIESREGQEK